MIGNLHTSSVGLSHQFLLTNQVNNNRIIPSFRQSTLLGWHLQSANDLPVNHLLNANGDAIGWLLGWACINNTYINSPFKVSSLAETLVMADYANVENDIYTLSGRWVAIFLKSEHPRVYLDPLASLSLVYSEKEQVIASTPRLFEAVYQAVYSIDDLLNQDLWYPFGASAYANTKRLLANHYVDLIKLEATRHWPVGVMVTYPWREQLGEVISLMQQQLIAFSGWHPVRLGLTAGMESRVMLASALKSGASYQCWTREDFSRSAQVDLKVASQLAKKFNLQHKICRIRPETRLSEQEILTLLETIGYAVGGSPIRSAALIDSIKQIAFSFTGIGGEIARAFYYESGNKEMPALTLQNMFKLSKLPSNPLFERLGQDYLAKLPNLTELQRWSLFYQENRVSAFGAVHRYAYQNGIIFTSPFSNRKIIEVMFQLSLPEQLKGEFHVELIKRLQPMLLEIPFNQGSFFQKIRRKLADYRSVFRRYR